jgi:hypothetical protein
MSEPKWLTEYWDMYIDLVTESTASVWELHCGGSFVAMLLVHSSEFVSEISVATHNRLAAQGGGAI